MKRTNFIRAIKSASKVIIGETSGNYGHDAIVYRYTGIPRWVPLNVRIQHGWYQMDHNVRDLESKNPLMLVWNSRIAQEWKRRSKRPVIVMGSPFVLYRRMEGLEKAANAEGTVVFPQHSTRNKLHHFDIDEYCRMLKELSTQFQPVTVCLHFRDLERLSPAFESAGFPVVTAGESRQGGTGFVDRYYDILRRHKYASSNDLGSYAFYAVELGIPFFLYGPAPQKRLRHDPTVLEAESQFKAETNKLFSPPRTTITEAQDSIARSELGLDDRVGREELRRRLLLLFVSEIPKYLLRALSLPFAAAWWRIKGSRE